MDKRLKMAFVGLFALSVMLSSCVEDQASVVMLGSLIGEGSVQEGVGQCEFTAEMEDVNVRTTGFINLADLANNGQPLVPGAAGSPDRYAFQAVFENRLFDSRTVGAQSGGTGGGFQNIKLDKNDIIISSATVAFTADNNSLSTDTDGGTATFELETERLASMLVMSGGGVATMGIPVINNSGERAQMEQFLTDLGVNADQSVTLIAEIQLHGETVGGTEVESNRLEYPIDVCLDCGRPTAALCSLS